MKKSLRLLLSTAVLACSTLTWASGPPTPDPTSNILYIFRGGSDGAYPTANLIFDAAGNLYGTTSGGGGTCDGFDCGTVFALTPNPGGGWTESVLHAFEGASDGLEPFGGLVFDAAGNLYGTTSSGGVTTYDCCGTVFEMSPSAGGGWTERFIYIFNSDQDGSEPIGSLTFDRAGNLYGVTGGGGLYFGGTVFELKRAANGVWHKQILHNFGSGSDGLYPYGNLIFDAADNLYGTANKAGTYPEGGIVFELSPSKGQWTEHILHNFGGANDGSEPYGGLVFDAAGNLYGATGGGGGQQALGTVFELSPASGGKWTERILHVFSTPYSHGASPAGNLIFDSAGNLYGETSEGGTGECVREGCGVVYELSPGTDGPWKETVLMGDSAATDGGFPTVGLLLDSAGNLYGMTGGGSGTVAYYGAVFEITK